MSAKTGGRLGARCVRLEGSTGIFDTFQATEGSGRAFAIVQSMNGALCCMHPNVGASYAYLVFGFWRVSFNDVRPTPFGKEVLFDGSWLAVPMPQTLAPVLVPVSYITTPF